MKRINKYNPEDHDNGKYVISFLKFTKCKSFDSFLNLTRKKQSGLIRLYLSKQTPTTIIKKGHAICFFLIENEINNISMGDMLRTPK